MNPTRWPFLILLLCLPMVTVTVAEEPPLTPKGIYHAVDVYHRTGVKFLVELQERGCEARRVPVTHDFRTGDRISFRFEINRDSYIYVINQTLQGTLEASGLTVSEMRAKGIERVSYRVERDSPPRLLFPTDRAGSNNRLRRNLPHSIPHRGYYVMDDLEGTEKLYVVLSDRPLDLVRYFHGDTGDVRGAGGEGRLREQLAEWKKNVEMELVDKDVVYDVASYGVSVDPTKPAVVEIDLRHGR